MNGDRDQREGGDDPRQRAGDVNAPFQHPEDAVRITDTEPGDGNDTGGGQQRAAHAEHQRLAQRVPEIGAHPVLYAANPYPATQHNERYAQRQHNQHEEKQLAQRRSNRL